MTSRILRIAVAFDIFIFAVLTLGGARRNETISAAAWSLEGDGKWQGKVFRPFIDLLFSPFQKDHCANAWLSEKHK
jgi:hypothetical protein